MKRRVKKKRGLLGLTKKELRSTVRKELEREARALELMIKTEEKC